MTRRWRRSQFRCTNFLSVLSLALLLMEAVSAFAEEKSMYRGKLVVEHPEVIPEGDLEGGARIYMRIWNGTQDYIYLERIGLTSGETLILKSADRSGGFEAATMPRSIPPLSEFAMTKNGFHIFAKSIGSAKTLTLIVEFSGTAPTRIEAKILSHDSEPTDHHHGSSDY